MTGTSGEGREELKGPAYYGNPARAINPRSTGVAITVFAVIGIVIAFAWLICAGSLIPWEKHPHLYFNLIHTINEGADSWQWIYVAPILLVLCDGISIATGAVLAARRINHTRGHVMLGLLQLLSPLLLSLSAAAFASWTLHSHRTYESYGVALEALGCKDKFVESCGVKEESNLNYIRFWYREVHVILISLGCGAFFFTILVHMLAALPVLCPIRIYSLLQEENSSDMELTASAKHSKSPLPSYTYL